MSRLPAVLVTLPAASLAIAGEPAPNRPLADFFEREYQWFLKQRPEYATFLGDERDNDRLADVSAGTEIDRCILDPGQALGYKIGELHIKRLLARAEKEPGDESSIRRFHNAIVDDGALPLTILEARIGGWIAAERPRTRRP